MEKKIVEEEGSGDSEYKPHWLQNDFGFYLMPFPTSFYFM